MIRLIINFENEASAERFMSWLENGGQEDYWKCMSETQDYSGTDDEPSAVVNFEYDYDDFVIDTESGSIDVQSELGDFGDYEDEEDL